MKTCLGSRINKLLVGAVLFACSPLCGAEDTIGQDNVAVSFTGISREHAQAIARTVSAARAVAVEKFGFDMPATINVTVAADPAAGSRLFNDGQDRFSLTIRSEEDLRQPSRSGTFHLYGLCHEVGHLAMYRPIRDHSWMTTAAAEGWAHYLGSRIVDEVYAREGPDLWPDAYDYRVDGMARLEKQLAAAEKNDVQVGAGLWKELVEALGDRALAPVFAAWGQLALDRADPGPKLGEAILKVTGEPRTAQWWNRAQATLVVQRPTSDFKVQEAKAEELQGKPLELACDDGTQSGKSSMAGGGHAVRFSASGNTSYVTSIRVYGARYGTRQAPDENFHLWLCDSEFRSIAEFAFPYDRFKWGKAQWVDLAVKPTLVPREFFVCAGFNPTATKGVFVGYDGHGGKASYLGLPGKEPRAFDKGNWMIRAVVSQVPVMRTWTDASGGFSVEAELVAVVDGAVRLKRKDGSKISVPLDRLSAADREFLQPQPAPEPEAPSAPEAPSEDAAPVELAGIKMELKRDDGVPAGRRSLPMGHGVRFESPDGDHFLTSVRIHGARYGHAQAPEEDFHVTLCSQDSKEIADFPFSYSKFRKGDAKWVSLRVKPTAVPREFIIYVGFNPTRTKGVFVSHDAQGKALVGRPGKPAGSFNGGDWLIRATVDSVKDHDFE